MLERRNVIEQRILAWGVHALRKFLQTLPPQLSVVIVAEAVRQFLVVRARHARLIVFFRQPRPPVKSRGGLVAPGIHPNLLVELFFRFVVSTKAQREPCRLPVRIRGTRSGGETLLQFAERVQRLVVLVVYQMQIRRREQRLLQPRTGGRGL